VTSFSPCFKDEDLKREWGTVCLKESGSVYDFLPDSKTRNKVYPLVEYI
jgi:hypothetical protein